MSASRTRRLAVLLASTMLLGLTGACVWGVWATTRPAVATFVPADAIDVQRQNESFAAERLTFRYNGSLRDERARLTTVALDGGWQRSHLLNDCFRYCTPRKVSYLYLRSSLFGTLREIVIVDQGGSGPYFISVMFRRCVVLPGLGCWPQ